MKTSAFPSTFRSSFRWNLALAVLVTLAGVSLAGCRHGRSENNDPVLQLSAAESLAKGQQLMLVEKYGQARKYLTHAFEVEPNSASGREALLLVADCLYKDGGTQNLVQAEAKYRDFLNRFPTSDRAPYVQLQIGNSLADRVERPDRDQNVTRQALVAYEDLMRLYPTSQEASQGKERMEAMRNKLGEHELQVARFYYRFGIPVATVGRLEFLLASYPEFGAKDEVYYYMGMALDRMGKPEEADQWFEKLRKEFPQSSYASQAPEARG
jgi:outer membrane protein assembly factor BamD